MPFFSYKIFLGLTGLVFLGIQALPAPDPAACADLDNPQTARSCKADTPSVRTADIGLLSNTEGASLDFLALALIGAGFGIYRLKRSGSRPKSYDHPAHAGTDPLSLPSSTASYDAPFRTSEKSRSIAKGEDAR